VRQVDRKNLCLPLKRCFVYCFSLVDSPQSHWYPWPKTRGFYRGGQRGGDLLFLMTCATLGLVNWNIMVWAVLWLIQKMMLSSDWRKIYACSGKRGGLDKAWTPEGTHPRWIDRKRHRGKWSPDGVFPRRACNNEGFSRKETTLTSFNPYGVLPLKENN
jgi:hypothetical protein